MDERAALRTIGHAIFHRRYVLVACVAFFTLAAGALSFVRPPTYQATALLFVDERFNSSQGFDLALQAGELLSAHFIQTATSEPVLARACSGTYFDTSDTASLTCTPATLTPHVSANTVRGTDWIGVSVTSSSPVAAAGLANAVAHGMLDQNKADIDRLMAPTRDYLEAQLKDLSAKIATEQATIQKLQAQATPNKPAAIAAEQAQLQLLQSQYSATYAKNQDLVIQENQLWGSLTLVQPAGVPLKPVDPDLVRYLVVGLAIGLCLGLAAAVLLDRFDDRLFDTESLASAAGTRLVVTVSQRESVSGSPRSAQVFGVARANLLAQHPNLRKVLVVAASNRDHVRPVAAAFGMAAVKAGQRVLVVDAEASSYVMQTQAGKNGSMMTIVSAANGHDGVINDEALDDRNGKYELTVMSAPSPDHDPTAVTVARTADIAIVVATARITRAADVRRTVETLRLAGLQVAASVFAVDTVKLARPEPEEPAATDLYEVAANQWRLPTWRGPAGS